MHRPFRNGDFVHCERTKFGLTQTVIRRIVSVTGQVIRVAQRDGSGATEALSDYEAKGIVIGRSERYTG